MTWLAIGGVALIPLLIIVVAIAVLAELLFPGKTDER